MLRPSLSTFAVLCLSASLGACASSRLDGPRTRGPSPQASLDTVPAMPSGTVTAAPLAPPPGVAAASSSPQKIHVPAAAAPRLVSAILSRRLSYISKNK